MAQSLRAENIETKKYFYPPLHQQTLYSKFHEPERNDLTSDRICCRWHSQLAYLRIASRRNGARRSGSTQAHRSLRIRSQRSPNGRESKPCCPQDNNFKLSHVAVRVLADLTSIHICMIAALVIAVTHPGLLSARVPLRPEEAVHYYTSVFLFLSLLFPAVFLLSGLYTRPRSYEGNRTAALFGGVVLSILLFAIVNFALYRHQQAPQGQILLFCGLAAVSLVLPRILKAALQQRFEVKARISPAAPFLPGSRLDSGWSGLHWLVPGSKTARRGPQSPGYG